VGLPIVVVYVHAVDVEFAFELDAPALKFDKAFAATKDVGTSVTATIVRANRRFKTPLPPSDLTMLGQ
jgi:hypothetical protein